MMGAYYSVQDMDWKQMPSPDHAYQMAQLQLAQTAVYQMRQQDYYLQAQSLSYAQLALQQPPSGIPTDPRYLAPVQLTGEAKALHDLQVRAQREHLGPAEHKGLRVAIKGRWRGWRLFPTDGV